MKVLSSITDTHDAVNKEYIDGLLSDYIKTSNLQNVTAGKATRLATSRKLWGNNFDGTKDVDGEIIASNGIRIEPGQSITFLDSKGGVRTIVFDEENDSIKILGNLYATGQNAAGDAGEEYPGMVTSWEDAPDDLTGYTVSAGLVKELRDKVENGGAANVEIKVNALSAYDGRTITTNAMQTLTGLTVDVAQSMLEGAYNKVIDNSGDYPAVWDYTAMGTSTGIIIYLRIGDGYDTNTAYALTYTQSAANWSIIMGEI